MPYLLILRRNQDEPLGEAEAEMYRRFASWTRAIQETGKLSAVERLMPATQGVTVSSRDGRAHFGGRYDASEDVIGYYLLSAGTLEEVQEAASGCPILYVGGTVEIRETQSFEP